MGKAFSLFIFTQCLLFSNICLAQGYAYETYDWNVKTTIYQPNEAELKMPATIVVDNRFIDYDVSMHHSDNRGSLPDITRTSAYHTEPSGKPGWYYMARNNGNPKIRNHNWENYEMFYTKHEIIRINNDRGITGFDTLCILLNDGDELIKLKGRIINADGSIKVLGKEDFNDISDYYRHNDFKTFSIGSLTKGCQFEYLYTVHRENAVLSGDEIFGNNLPIKEGNLVITSPVNLFFATQCYNDLPEPVYEKTKDSLNVIRNHVIDIPPVTDEAFAPRNGNKMAMAYKAIIDSKHPDWVPTWTTASTYFYKKICGDINDVKVSGILGDLHLGGLSMERQIAAIEHYIKGSIKIVVSGDENDDFSDPEKVIGNKIGTRTGILRVYAAIFHRLNIPFKLVYTSNRKDAIFNKDYMVGEDFREVMFYFAFSGKYVAPFFESSSYGFPPSTLAYNYGLFIDTINQGKIGVIHGMNISNTSEIFKAELAINKDMDSVEVKQQYKCTGYRATELFGKYERVDAEEKEKIISTFNKRNGIDHAKILDQIADDQTMDTTGEKKFSITTNYRTENLIAKAGNEYLLNLGDIINKHKDLVKESKETDENRVSDLSIPYPIQYLRTIQVKIPVGYKITQLNDLKVDKAVADSNGNRTCQFTSFYSINGEILNISISEAYYSTYYPKDRYKDFMQVVNSANDFNKIQLVLEKE